MVEYVGSPLGVSCQLLGLAHVLVFLITNQVSGRLLISLRRTMHRHLAVGCVGFGFGFRLRRRRHLKQFGVVTAFFPCGARLGSARLSPSNGRKERQPRPLHVCCSCRIPIAGRGGGGIEREEGKLPFGPLLIRLTAEELPSSPLLPRPPPVPFLTPLSTFIASCSALLKHGVSLHF